MSKKLVFSSILTLLLLWILFSQIEFSDILVTIKSVDPIGVVAGVLFSGAFPETAQGINETLYPLAKTFGELAANKIKEVALTLI